MRRVPPAILLALAFALASLVLRIIVMFNFEAIVSGPSWILALGGVLGFACNGLLVVGMLQLRQRTAAIAFSMLIAVRMASVLLVDPDQWNTHTVRLAADYAGYACQLVVLVALAVAVRRKQAVLAVFAIGAALLAMPAVTFGLEKLVGGDYRTAYVVELLVRLPSLVAVLLVSAEVAGDFEPQPVIAADGLRHASRALCAYSVLAALIGVRAIDQPLVLAIGSVATLSWAGFGVARAASLNRWVVTAAAAMLFCSAGMHVSQLARLRLHFAVPDVTSFVAVLCLFASGCMRIALGGVVEKIQLQAKGMGALFMFTTALAIQLMLMSPSHPRGAQIALGVLTGFSMALGAWMLAILCRYGAQRLESTDGDLPAARIV